MTQVWPWLLSAVALCNMWALGNKWRIGFLGGLASQGLWITYALVTRQWGFVPMAGIFAVVYLRGYRKWGQP